MNTQNAIDRVERLFGIDPAEGSYVLWMITPIRWRIAVRVFVSGGYDVCRMAIGIGVALGIAVAPGTEAWSDSHIGCDFEGTDAAGNEPCADNSAIPRSPHLPQRFGPSRIDTLLSGGQGAYNNRDWTGCVSAYSEVIQADRNIHLAWARRAECYARLGVYDEALSDIENAIRLNPGQQSYLTTQGTILLWQSHARDIAEHREKLAKLEPVIKSCSNYSLLTNPEDQPPNVLRQKIDELSTKIQNSANKQFGYKNYCSRVGMPCNEKTTLAGFESSCGWALVGIARYTSLLFDGGAVTPEDAVKLDNEMSFAIRAGHVTRGALANYAYVLEGAGRFQDAIAAAERAASTPVVPGVSQDDGSQTAYLQDLLSRVRTRQSRAAFETLTATLRIRKPPPPSETTDAIPDYETSESHETAQWMRAAVAAAAEVFAEHTTRRVKGDVEKGIKTAVVIGTDLPARTVNIIDTVRKVGIGAVHDFIWVLENVADAESTLARSERATRRTPNRLFQGVSGVKWFPMASPAN